MHVASTRSSRLRRILVVGALLVAAGAVIAGGAFWVTGGRWFVVRTPSMGTAAPVGSLVLTRPADIGSLHVGDIIAYHPPTERGTTYTHRIVKITAAGLRTRGDINGAVDPWVVTQHDIVGHAFAVPALGWLLRAAPLLLVGGMVLWGLTMLWLPVALRGPVRMVGGSLLFGLTVVLLKPFVNVVQLATRTTGHGAYIQTVSTGILPVQLTAANARAKPVVLGRAGQVGLSHFTGGRAGEQYRLQIHLHLNTLQWIAAAFVCLAPLLWTLVVGYRTDDRRGAIA